MTVRRIVILGVISAAVVGVTFAYVLPKLAAYTSVAVSLRQLTWYWLLSFAILTVANVLTFAVPWLVALPNLRFLTALEMTQVSTAFSYVVPGGAPLGMGVSFAMLRNAGFDRDQVGLAVTLTGVWNQLATFVFPVVAVVLLAAQGAASSSLRLAAMLGVVLGSAVVAAVVALFWSPRFASWSGAQTSRLTTRARALLRRGPVRWSSESFVRFRSATVERIRATWPTLTGATLLNQATSYLIFECAVRALGIGLQAVPVAAGFAAWSIGRLLNSLPLTPGGLGTVELGMTGVLVALGAPHAPAVAAVLLYRALTVVPTLMLGLPAAALWRVSSRHLAVGQRP